MKYDKIIEELNADLDVYNRANRQINTAIIALQIAQGLLFEKDE